LIDLAVQVNRSFMRPDSTKRKPDGEPQNLAHKEERKTAGEQAMINKHSTLVNQLKVVKQGLGAEKKKTRALGKRIGVLGRWQDHSNNRQFNAAAKREFKSHTSDTLMLAAFHCLCSDLHLAQVWNG
jgi:hypothetical protein